MSKKTKLTLADFSPKPFKMILKHPESGKEMDAWVEVTTALSNEYVLKAIEMNKNINVGEGNVDAAAILNLNAELVATCVTNWDEEFFGMECTTSNVVNVLSNMSYVWIRDQLSDTIADKDNFFTKA